MRKVKRFNPKTQLYDTVQAAIGGKIVARESIKGFKKDVLTKKIHGGGATDRKRKLLENRKRKKRDQNNSVKLKYSRSFYRCPKNK